MTLDFGHSFTRFLMMLAVALQLLLPGALALVQTNGVDLSRFICAPSGAISADARTAAERIAKLMGEDKPDEPPFEAHCPLCTLVHGAMVFDPATLAAPRVAVCDVDFVRYASSVAREAQGPPTGSRGPPAKV